MLNWLTSDVDSRPLGLTRIIVGIAAGVRSLIALPVLIALTDSNTLRVPHADWIPSPTTGLAITIVMTWLIGAILFTIGWKVIWSGSIVLACIVLTLAIDQQLYANHLYLMAWLVFLLILADSGSGLSIGSRDRPVVRWPVLLIMSQVSIVYFYSALTKFNPGFMSGKVLASVLHGGMIPFPDAIRTPTVLSIVAVGAVLIELFVAIFIWRPALRPAAFVLGLILHTSITLLMSGPLELFVFSLEMLAVYPLFLNPGPLRIDVDSSCDDCLRLVGILRRFDHLRVLWTDVGALDTSSMAQSGQIRLLHAGRTTQGFAAIARILEHLVPWLWIAPVLRVPGLAHLGSKAFERRISVPRRQTQEPS